MVVAGDSAGGNNAAVLVRRLRDGGVPLPALQVLVYPPVDAVAYRDVDAYPSYRENGSGYGLEYADGLYYWDHYLGPDGDPANPDASPLRAPSLAGLPPTYVLSVEYDVLRDENRAYADALRSAGVPVEHRHWEGHLHGFLGDPAAYDDADTALAEIATAVPPSHGRPAPTDGPRHERDVTGAADGPGPHRRGRVVPGARWRRGGAVLLRAGVGDRVGPQGPVVVERNGDRLGLDGQDAGRRLHPGVGQHPADDLQQLLRGAERVIGSGHDDELHGGLDRVDDHGGTRGGGAAVHNAVHGGLHRRGPPFEHGRVRAVLPHPDGHPVLPHNPQLAASRTATDRQYGSEPAIAAGVRHAVPIPRPRSAPISRRTGLERSLVMPGFEPCRSRR